MLHKKYFADLNLIKIAKVILSLGIPKQLHCIKLTADVKVKNILKH